MEIVTKAEEADIILMDPNDYDHVLFAIHRKAANKLVVRTRIHTRIFPTGLIKLVGDGLSQSMSLKLR